MALQKYVIMRFIAAKNTTAPARSDEIVLDTTNQSLKEKELSTFPLLRTERAVVSTSKIIQTLVQWLD